MKASEKYKAMTRPERRVAIAKDVIKTVRAGGFGGVDDGLGYIEGKGARCGVNIDSDRAQEIMPTCSVCARGAMMLCRIAKFNAIEVFVDEIVRRDHTTQALEDAFGEKQMNIIEAAFECREGYAEYTSLARKAVAFGDQFENPSKRLIAIMKNIVDNGGTFKPAVKAGAS
jgi:hypothetical protein